MRAAAVLVSVFAVLLGACGSDSSSSARSGERSEQGDSPDSGGSSVSGEDFCARLEAMSADEVEVDEDPEAAREAAEQLRELADTAPPEVADAMAVFAELVDRMAGMDDMDDMDDLDDEAGMEAFGEIMMLMFDPEVIEAAATLEDYLVEECGLDPAEAEGLFGTDGLDGGGTSEPDVSIPEGDEQFPDTGGAGTGSGGDATDISLDDMDALEEANASASWTQKSVSTGIANDQYITLSSLGSGEDTFTADEALEACEAVRLAFQDRQPELQVEVLNGETVVATGSAGVACTLA